VRVVVVRAGVMRVIGDHDATASAATAMHAMWKT
jgi:hypothetical protein